MKLLKTTTLVLCMSISACSSFYKDETAHIEKPAAPVPQIQADADKGHWWWPFSKGDKTVTETKAAAKAQELKVSQEWFELHEKAIREAVAGSKVQVERRENGLVLIANVDDSFNPDRAEMLLPSMLGPLGRTAKLVGQDEENGVIILGHTDSTGSEAVNDKLSLGRAKAVASIFRLSGMGGSRLVVRGLSATQPRADNASPEGRALNRRVEVLIQPRAMVLASLASLQAKR
ncbi:OmpA family protein [Pseudomonas duriflava]|uniref:OmpA family protein n=1 Tax=Pseudomonas duriflava TaxID=459528 RepID=A0A562Q8G9_9PSED|nr:OmpA family protein [Pseudomonas duriflava]TWI53061.1 OmpA family protein [Pseudomonas duriflava]